MGLFKKKRAVFIENADLATAAENFLFPASPTYYG